jgi:hypothetical protein
LQALDFCSLFVLTYGAALSANQAASPMTVEDSEWALLIKGDADANSKLIPCWSGGVDVLEAWAAN